MREGEFEDLRVVLASAKAELARVRWEGRVCAAEAEKDEPKAANVKLKAAFGRLASETDGLRAQIADPGGVDPGGVEVIGSPDSSPPSPCFVTIA